MNKVILIGNLTKDPETSTVGSGISLCKFSIAVNRNFNNADGSKQTDFFNIVCWRMLADNCGRSLKKGNKVGICGSIQTRTYDGPDGTRRYMTEIVADEVQFLTPKGEAGDNLPELPEVQQSSNRRSNKIEDLKPLADDGDLPF